MATETIVRPDAKGRVGLGSYLRRIATQLGRMPSGFAAELTGDGAIMLRPRVEVAADEASTLVLSVADRDRLLSAIDGVAAPNPALLQAKGQHDATVGPA